MIRRRLKCSLGLSALLALLSGTVASAGPSVTKWDGLTPTVNGSIIRFQPLPGRDSVAPLNVAPLRNLTWISWLRPASDAIPYVLVSANSPEALELSLFIVRADGKLKPQRLTFPGKLLDPKTRETVHESRAFYGRCLPTQEHDAVVLYQRDRQDRKRGLQSSLYVAEASPDLLSEKLIERRLPSIKTVQLRVKTKQCTEIPGKNRVFNASFFQFRNRGANTPDDESADTDRNDEKADDNSGKEGPSDSASVDAT